MKAFFSSIIIQNTLVEYEIFRVGNKFKALLQSEYNHQELPFQLTFWKEDGRWKTYNQINDHVLYQFASTIDNHLMSAMVAEMKAA